MPLKYSRYAVTTTPDIFGNAGPRRRRLAAPPRVRVDGHRIQEVRKVGGLVRTIRLQPFALTHRGLSVDVEVVIKDDAVDVVHVADSDQFVDYIHPDALRIALQQPGLPEFVTNP